LLSNAILNYGFIEIGCLKQLSLLLLCRGSGIGIDAKKIDVIF
jgi:hypothetical protein